MGANQTLEALWKDAAMPSERLADLTLSGADPVLRSSFAVGTAAQTSIAAAALAANAIGVLRGGAPQSIRVDMREAALECTGYFSVDGRTPQVWDPIAGLYACGRNGDTGWVRLHTNFAHHRDGLLRLLHLLDGAETPKEAVAAALREWNALTFEQAAANEGLVVAAVRRFDEWDRHPHAAFVNAQPLINIERIGDAAPLSWPELPDQARPLLGLRVLDLTRILAGPICGRTLAAYGAEVMLVNSPKLPNIAAIADTSRGKLSVHLDLKDKQGARGLQRLIDSAHVFVQGYRPGALRALGFDPKTVAARRPGIVYVSLSAYGEQGPWGSRRGFDSLVQTATGFNHAEAEAAGSSSPQAMPAQILDYASGFLMAFGAQAALHRQRTEGGSWQVRVSLARTAQWLRSMGRISDGFSIARPSHDDLIETTASGFGQLAALRHAAHFSRTPAGWTRPSMPPGSHPPSWPPIATRSRVLRERLENGQ